MNVAEITATYLNRLKQLFCPSMQRDDVKNLNSDSYNRPKLTREDILRRIEKNNGPIGLDLSGYDLSGVNLSKLDLQGMVFGNLDIAKFSEADVITKSANLEGAWLERANLRNVNFGRTNLKGARFYNADLTDASLWAANAEAADFRNANLSRADLYSTILKDCQLADAVLTGANLHLANLSGATLTAESLKSGVIQEKLSDYKEYYERWYINPIVKEKYQQRHLDVQYKEAMEIYLALKNSFLNSGRYDDASWAYIKERQMERKTFFPLTARKYYGYQLIANHSVFSWRYWLFYSKYSIKWVSACITELLIGYGERPLRMLFGSALIILLFPFLYYLSAGIINSNGYPIRWIDYFHYSIAAFSTIGFPDLVPANDVAKFLTSSEALLGIASLALLMFALGNRINRS